MRQHLEEELASKVCWVNIFKGTVSRGQYQPLRLIRTLYNWPTRGMVLYLKFLFIYLRFKVRNATESYRVVG
jgi:hypothetical protein